MLLPDFGAESIIDIRLKLGVIVGCHNGVTVLRRGLDPR
jgi:hypothetical protein